MDFDLAEALFKHMVINNPSEDGKVFDFNAIVSGTDGPDDKIEHARTYTERLATTAPSLFGHAFVNGKHHELGDVRKVSMLERHLELTVPFLGIPWQSPNRNRSSARLLARAGQSFAQLDHMTMMLTKVAADVPWQIKG